MMDHIEQFRDLTTKSPLMAGEARYAIVELFKEVDRLRGRVTELLVANNLEVEKRRKAELAALPATSTMAAGMDQ
jgi:hypothetical protein